LSFRLRHKRTLAPALRAITSLRYSGEIQNTSKDANGVTNLLDRSSFFYARNATKLGFNTEYGNYMGATSFYTFSKNGDFNNGIGINKLEYFYGVPAVDAVDKAAQAHDQGYDKLNAQGSTGLFNDWGTTPVDKQALDTWDGILSKYKVGDRDPVSGQKVTKEELDAANSAKILFGNTVLTKQGRIADFMSDFYPKEAENTTSVFSANSWSYSKYSKAIQHNYQLFLQKYMLKDKDGNWQRNSKMWHQDDKGNWQPNKPK